MALEGQDDEFAKWANEQGLSLEKGNIHVQQKGEYINPVTDANDLHIKLLESIKGESERQTQLIKSIEWKVAFWFWLSIIGLILYVISLLLM
jgi:hypothetical protein